MTPARGLVLVRPIETPDSLPNSRILLTEATRTDWTAGQMEVIEVGAHAICEDSACERAHWVAGDRNELHHDRSAGPKVGQWVLVRHRALLETNQEGLFAAHEDDVLAVLNS